MDILTARKIHCIGIGGIGVSALAALWRAQGKEVSGSDMAESEITHDLKNRDVSIFVGQKIETSHFFGVDLVVYSDAVPKDNVERVAARAHGIPELSYAQALGQVSREYKTIVVTGTHGKSTTTAMLGLILEAAGLDPLVLVGSRVPEWGNLNLRLCTTPNPSSTRRGNETISSPAKGEVRRGLSQRYFVVEGDDYRDHFLELQPYAVVVTSIEWDHPDYFRDLEHTVGSFKTLVEKVPEEGFVILNEDDPGCRLLHPAILQDCRMARYGKGSEIFSKLQLQVPGEFNRYNATAAATAALELGVSMDVVQKALHEFKGIWRRFEIVGELPPPLTPPRAGGESVEIYPPLGGGVRGGPITIISDYAHHPTAIRETMKAAREAYPGRRLVLVYQPHQHSRTKHLFQDFVEVLSARGGSSGKDAADVVIVSEIYAVKGRMEDRDVSSRDIVNEVRRYGGTKVRSSEDRASTYLLTHVPTYRILYGGDLKETKRMVFEQIQPGDVVIFMGAGDIDEVARQLVKAK